MKKAEQKKRHKTSEKANKNEVQILANLYKYRVMTIDQLQVLLSYTKSTLYHKLLQLQKNKEISSANVRGFTREGGIKGKYYYITNTGLTRLRNNGVKVEHHHAQALQVASARIPFLLNVNDLAIHFSSHGWELEDSRKIKARYQLNRNDSVHGQLISPIGQRYLFYVYLEKVSMEYVIKTREEIKRYNELGNIILFAKGHTTFQQIFSEMMINGDIFNFQSLRILPYDYAKRYLPLYDDKEELLTFLTNVYGIKPVKKKEGERYQVDFPTVVEKEGEEYYLVNFLDHNLPKIYHIQKYTTERYKTDGRKVLALLLKEQGGDLYFDYKMLIGNMKHVEYLEIEDEFLLNYPKERFKRYAEKVDEDEILAF